LLAPRGGFYETTEVTDLLNLLRLLDNPLQDLPVLAVLRSPLVGLNLDEMARIRLADRNGRFWIALQRWVQSARDTPSSGPEDAAEAGPDPGPPFPETQEKVERFLTRFNRWRTLSRRAALSHCLETVLDETQYETWLRTQPRGGQRAANVQRLLGLTREFDRLQRRVFTGSCGSSKPNRPPSWIRNRPLRTRAMRSDL
jgi:ATP-dependent helicase/nuclease subunit A